MTKIGEQWGLPVVKESQLRGFLEDQGLRPWVESEPPLTFNEYAARDLSNEQRNELKWAPEVKVRSLIDPRTGEPFAGFFTETRHWVCVVTLLPTFYTRDPLIALTAEYKHGINDIVIVPPCGTPIKQELLRGSKRAMQDAAMREYLEETGIRLQNVTPLLPNPIAVSPRQTDLRFQPFLGYAALPIIPQPRSLDGTEVLITFLMKMSEWKKVIKSGFGGDLCGITTTQLVLEHFAGMY